MKKISKLIICRVPFEYCNLSCEYCYVPHYIKDRQKRNRIGHSPKEIRQAFSTKRLGGPSLIRMCAGGETMLCEELFPVVRELLEEGHYISIVTNGTVNSKFDEITSLPANLREKIYFEFSFHFMELKQKNLLTDFFRNINLMRDSGCSVSVDLVPNDNLIVYIDEIKQLCMENLGALCHLTIPSDASLKTKKLLSSMSYKEFTDTWKTFDSEQFNFKLKIFGEKRTEFCGAGDLSLYVFLDSGDYRQCYDTAAAGNIYENIEKPLSFNAVGYCCPSPHCDNGHTLLTMGLMPSLKSITPTYEKARNRICADGSEWINGIMKDVLSCQLSENLNDIKDK